MPSDSLLNFLEIVVKAGLVAVSAVTVAFSIGIAVALLVTRPKRVVVPEAATAPVREQPAATELLPSVRPSAA